MSLSFPVPSAGGVRAASRGDVRVRVPLWYRL